MAGYVDQVTLPNGDIFDLQDKRITDTSITNWNSKMFCYYSSSDETLVISPAISFDIPEPGSDTF